METRIFSKETPKENCYRYIYIYSINTKKRFIENSIVEFELIFTFIYLIASNNFFQPFYFTNNPYLILLVDEQKRIISEINKISIMKLFFLSFLLELDLNPNVISINKNQLINYPLAKLILKDINNILESYYHRNNMITKLTLNNVINYSKDPFQIMQINKSKLKKIIFSFSLKFWINIIKDHSLIIEILIFFLKFIINFYQIEEKRKKENKLINKQKSKIKMYYNKKSFLEQNNKTKKLFDLKGTRKMNKKFNKIINNKRKNRAPLMIKNKKNINNYIFIIKLLIVINLFNRALSYYKINYLELKYSKITLKIKGIGNKNIFSGGSEFSFESSGFPDEVYINSIKKTPVTYTYYLDSINNVVELRWTNKINDCTFMFRSCSDITEIDLSQFDSSEVMQMYNMFEHCTSLTSINLSNLDTRNVYDMQNMFEGCSSLTSLDLSSFQTSGTYGFYAMFANCTSLTSLDSSNFVLVDYISFSKIFEGCSNLEYINLISFDKINDFNKDFFINVPDNVVVCINEQNTQILSEIQGKACYRIDCSEDWKSRQRKIIKGTNECLDDCESDSKYEYNGKCYGDCSSGFILGEDNVATNTCKCELEKCLSCPNVALNFGLCTKCNKNYYPIENDPLNIGEYINCYNETHIGYYLDETDSVFKKCYDTCEACELNGDSKTHNCLTCHEDFPYVIEVNQYFNCFETCNKYFYYDSNNITHCTLDLSCPEKYPTLLEDKKQCIFREEPTTQMNNIEPTTQMNNIEPTTQINNLEPTTQLNNIEPTTQLNNIEPTTQMNKLEPTTQMNKIEPTTQMNIIEPTTQMNNLKDTTQLNNIEPTSQMNDIELTTQMNNIEPTTQMTIVEPTTNINNKEPTPKIYLNDNTKETQIINSEISNSGFFKPEITTSMETQKYINENNIEIIIKDILKNKTEEDEINYYDEIINIIESYITNENYNITNIENGDEEYFEIKKLSIKFSSIKDQENIINNNITDIDFKL